MATNILAKLFDEKIVAALSVLLRKRNDFGVRELAREANVSIATTYRIIQKLASLGVIAKSKQGKSTTYTTKKESKAFNELYKLIIGPKPEAMDILRSELDRRVGASNYRVLIRGSGKDKKTFVVSEKITGAMHAEISSIINIQTGAKLAFATITAPQSKQMQAMGLL